MNRFDILKEVRDTAERNMMLYKGNEERKQEFEHEAAKLELCEHMMAEVQYKPVSGNMYGRYANAFIGQIDGWQATPRYDGASCYISKLHFSVRDGYNAQHRDFDVAVELQAYFLSGQYDRDRHERYYHPDGNKGDMVKLTVIGNTVECFAWWEPGNSPFVGVL